MKKLITAYSIYIIAFALFTSYLILKSDHPIDKDFLVVNFLSLLIFTATAYYLRKPAIPTAKIIQTSGILLVLTGAIFLYYINDFIKEVRSFSEVSFFILIPVVALLLTIVFLISTLRKWPKDN